MTSLRCVQRASLFHVSEFIPCRTPHLAAFNRPRHQQKIASRRLGVYGSSRGRRSYRGRTRPDNDNQDALFRRAMLLRLPAACNTLPKRCRFRHQCSATDVNRGTSSNIVPVHGDCSAGITTSKPHFERAGVADAASTSYAVTAAPEAAPRPQGIAADESMQTGPPSFFKPRPGELFGGAARAVVASTPPSMLEGVPTGFKKHYRIGHKLGAGEYGVVMACASLATGEQHAVKVCM